MKVLVIAGRELAALLGSVVGWLVLTAFLLVSGAAFALAVTEYLRVSEQLVLSPYAGFSLTYAEQLFAPLFNLQAFLLLFLVPGVTMRLFSEELRQQTLELLLTSPVSLWEVVLGKFVGAATFLAVMLAGTAVGPLLLMLWAPIEPVPLLLGYLGTWLVGACVIAMGMAFSATTSHQILALALSVGFAFLLMLAPAFADADPTGLAENIGIFRHMADLVVGVLRLSDIAYFVAFIGFFLLATQQRLAMRRWA